MPQRPTQRIGWILYDDGCGVCSRWALFWHAQLRRAGLDIAPLSADWVRDYARIDRDALLRDIQLLRLDGTVVSGAAAYRHVMRLLWWAYPLYILASAPGLRRVFDRAYRLFADHRMAISHVCRLT